MRKIINRYSDDVDAFDSNALADRIAERRRAEVGEKMLKYYQDRPGKAARDLEDRPLMNIGKETEGMMYDEVISGARRKKLKNMKSRMGGR